MDHAIKATAISGGVVKILRDCGSRAGQPVALFANAREQSDCAEVWEGEGRGRAKRLNRGSGGERSDSESADGRGASKSRSL